MTNPAPDNSNSSGQYFAVDRASSQKLCSQAKALLQLGGDQSGAEKLLLAAIRHRPACMLAYQMLSEVCTTTGEDEAASLCRRGVLPDRLLRKIVEHINDACRATDGKGVERMMLFAAQQLPLPPPGVLKPPGSSESPPGSFLADSIKSRVCFVDSIEKGLLWHDTQHTMVFDGDQREVAEHTVADTGLIRALVGEHSAYHLQGRVFLFGARGSHNFYHWMLDIAPKLGVLLEAGYRFLPTDRFVVANASAGFARQLLNQFGVDHDQVYETEKEFCLISADELVVPFVENRMGLSMGPWVPELMRKQFLPANGEMSRKIQRRLDSDTLTSRGVHKRRLFVCRDTKSADGRAIKNQAALFNLLQEYGFEKVNPENLPLRQQAILFSESDVVVAAHGAALSNLVFCDAGSTVIEFYAGHIAPCYRAISALCELRYYSHFCSEQESDQHTKGDGLAEKSNSPRSGDITVSLAAMRALLNKAGLNSKS